MIPMIGCSNPGLIARSTLSLQSSACLFSLDSKPKQFPALRLRPSISPRAMQAAYILTGLKVELGGHVLVACMLLLSWYMSVCFIRMHPFRSRFLFALDGKTTSRVVAFCCFTRALQGARVRGTGRASTGKAGQPRRVRSHCNEHGS